MDESGKLHHFSEFDQYGLVQKTGRHSSQLELQRQENSFELFPVDFR